QAEDGIRDFHVTGVQTCALPIYYRMWEKANPGLGTIKDYNELAANVERAKNDPDFLPTVLTKDFNLRDTVAGTWLTFDQINNERSEERRVGKEWKCRRWRNRETK